MIENGLDPKLLIMALWALSMAVCGLLYRGMIKRQDDIKTDLGARQSEIMEGLKEVCRAHEACQAMLPREFVLKEEYKDERERIWKNLKGHRHNGMGRVILPE